MLLNIGGLPRVADPHIRNSHCSKISVVVKHVRRQMAFLVLVFVVQHEYGEGGRLISPLLLSRRLYVLFEFLDRVFQCGSGVIDFVDDENVLANQVAHLERGQIEPLCSCDFGAGCFDRVIAGELLVEG